MAHPISLAVLSASLAGLIMRGAAVAVDPSWSSAASLPGETLNAWRSMRGLLPGRGGEENPLEASIKGRVQEQVDAASKQYQKVNHSALAGAVTEMEVALKELSEDDAAVIEAVRHPGNFETHLRRRTASHRQNVEAAAEPFFNDLTRIVADEFIYRAPGSRTFNLAALKQVLTGQKQLSDQHKKAHEHPDKITNSINNTSMTPSHMQAGKLLRFGNRPQVTAGFVTREGQDELFDAVFTRAEPRTVLTGMRGSGKTQLAAAIAARCEEEGWPLVAWIHAASRKQIIADLYELALRTGIDAPNSIPLEVIVRRLMDHLRSADGSNSLFVFDNVENPNDLRDLIPESTGVRTLITTTRHLDWDDLGWLRFTVGAFDREQSITLLCERTVDTHREAADRIADALGDLPVAIAQAAATAKQGGYTLSGYLDRLSHHPLESSISPLEGDDYPNAVGIALLMAYEQVLEQLRIKHPQQERIAVSLLDTLSLLTASGVPTHWLLRLDSDSDAVRDTLSFLKSVAIFQESSDGDKSIIPWLQGHVYRETYLNDQKKLGQARSCAATLLSGIDVDRLENPEQRRDETHHLIEQLLSVTSQDYSQSLFSEPQVSSKLAETLHYATSLGMSQLALCLTDSVTQACDVLGPDHPDTLASRNNLAGTYRDAGRLDKAIALYEQTLEDSIRVLGSDHPGTLTSRLNLAGAYQAAGRLDEAITLYEQVFSGRSRVLGPDHRSTLTARDKLAGIYREAGRFDEAITLKKQILADAMRIMGPDSPGASAARNNLAATYRDAGRLDEAIPLYQQNLEDVTRLSGLDHPETLASRGTLAGAYRDAGRLDEAIPLFEQNLAEFIRILGPDRPDTFTSRSTLAGAYQAAGRLDEAIPLFEQNLEDRTRTLGPAHPVTLTSRGNLAGAYREAGRLDEAIRLFGQTLEDSIRILGSQDPRTLTSRGHLAGTYREAGRLDEAIRLFEQKLADFARLAGPDHLDTLTSRGNLANAYQAAGRLDQAIALFERNLTDFIRVLGPAHPETLAWRDSLAGAYQAAGRLDQAIALFERNLTDFIRVLGPAHPETLASRGNLAGAYQAAGRLDQAILLLQQNLEDRSRILGPNHRDTLASRNNLAGAYQAAGRIDQAIPLLQQTLDESARILGPHHPRTLTSRNNLAGAYQAAGRLHEAIPLFEQALTDHTYILGPHHPDTLNTRNNLAGAYQAAGRLHEAIPLFEQTLTDCTYVLGPQHPLTLSTRNHLANAYLAVGRSEEARKLFGTP
ncbi:tetratricopeptide repeat protein [Actinomyces naeslundii]